MPSHHTVHLKLSVMSTVSQKHWKKIKLIVNLIIYKENDPYKNKTLKT